MTACGGNDDNDENSSTVNTQDVDATVAIRVETGIAGTVTAVAQAATDTLAPTSIPITPTDTVTTTHTPSATLTLTSIPTDHPTQTDTPSQTPSSTLSPSATATDDTPSATVITRPTNTRTPSQTPTTRPTQTPSMTPSPLPTATPLPVIEVSVSLPYDINIMNMVGALNEWRLEQGLWPVKINDTLNAMALEQAEYVISLSSIPAGSDIHLGPGGETLFSRAARPEYNWPSYSSKNRITIAEIAYVGASINSAINFWQGSKVHRNTVTNDAYREIGVGIVPHPYGSLWIVVFGSRPGVLPAFTQPQTGVLYLSNETYQRAAADGWVQNANLYQILDNADISVETTAWVSWTAQTALPTTALSAFNVAYSDGTREAITLVDPVKDILWVSSTIAAAQEGALVLRAINEQAVLIAPTITPTALREVTSVPTSVPASSDSLLLIYSDRSLTVMNNTSRALDLTDIVIESADGERSIPLTSWDNQFATVPVSFFPALGCVQVWSWNETTALATARECRSRRSVISVSPSSLFWATGEFVVRDSTTVLATCSPTASQCVVPLP